MKKYRYVYHFLLDIPKRGSRIRDKVGAMTARRMLNTSDRSFQIRRFSHEYAK